MKHFIIISLALLISNFSYSSHLIGGEITYQHISGNDYEVSATLYRDCSGIAAPPSVAIDFISTCNSFTSNINLVSFDTVQYCQGTPTTCSGGILPGVEWYLFMDTVQINPCADWEISYELCCRNTSQNINNSSGESFRLETILDNSSSSNSSPIFNQSLNLVAEVNNPICINNNAFDSDGDSLIYSLVNPLGAGGNPVTFSGGYTVNQPFGTGTNFSFNPANGNICFTPNQIGNFVTAVQVDEYSNGVLVGSTVRDIQLTVVNGVSVGTQDISGTLFDDLGNPVGGETVELFEYGISQGTLNLIASQTTNASGAYSFTGQNVNQYLVRAQSTGNYLPTYHESTSYWQHAQVVYSICDAQVTADITYVDVNNPMGTGVIAGYLNGSGVFRAGDPIEGVNVLLYELGTDELVQNSITDANGYYELENIQDGNYYILVDAEGLGMTSTHFFDFNDGEIIENANFFASEDGVYIVGDYEVTGYASVSEVYSNLTLFPNPGNNIVTVKDTKGKSFHVSIYSVSGQKIKELSAENQQNIDVSNFESGVYIFNITQENETKIIKWVKE